MPRSQGTSRKGKPGKYDRASGMGRSLQKKNHPHGTATSSAAYKPRSNGKSQSGDGGMAHQPGLLMNRHDVADAEQLHQHPRSVLELHDLDDFLQQADLAEREFTSEREGLVVLDASSRAYKGSAPPTVQWADQSKSNGDVSAFVFTELSVPRRPAWQSSTTKEELEAQERAAFLEWRRGVAYQEQRLMQYNSNNDTNNSATTTTIAATPFEKNLQVWRQLWRVLERSSCLLQLVDARNPLFYLSKDLRDYCQNDLHNGNNNNKNNNNGKPMMVLVNKSDYLTAKQRQMWHNYLVHIAGWDTVLFFSATLEQQKLDQAAKDERQRQQNEELFAATTTTLPPQQDLEAVDENDDDDDNDDGSDDDDDTEENQPDEDGQEQQSPVPLEPEDSCSYSQGSALESTDAAVETKNDDKDGGVPLLNREQLMEAMLDFARKHNCPPDHRFENRIQFGMVGFPNVGKSSVINVLVGTSKHTHNVVRVGVASQPGKTKHFQTLLLPDCPDMMLCDCPGLVFPSFVSNTADLIAAGVYPISQMRDHWPVVQLICQRIPRRVLNAQYGIQLPVPALHELRERGWPTTNNNSNSDDLVLPPPTAEELLYTYCIARSMLAAFSGVPDYPRAARIIIKDYADGKLLYCHAPPPPPLLLLSNNSNNYNLQTAAFYAETVTTALQQTKRLRDKLLKDQQQQQQQQAETIHRGKRGADQQQHDCGSQHPTAIGDSGDRGQGKERDDVVMDEALLALIGASAPTDSDWKVSTATATAGKKVHQKKSVTPRQKWGKKDRKNRNKDPYGCHSTPDAALFNHNNSSNNDTTSNNSRTTTASGGGVIVNAGKYSQSGYTRPASYPEVSAAAVEEAI